MLEMLASERSRFVPNIPSLFSNPEILTYTDDQGYSVRSEHHLHGSTVYTAEQINEFARIREVGFRLQNVRKITAAIHMRDFPGTMGVCIFKIRLRDKVSDVRSECSVGLEDGWSDIGKFRILNGFLPFTDVNTTSYGLSLNFDVPANLEITELFLYLGSHKGWPQNERGIKNITFSF